MDLGLLSTLPLNFNSISFLKFHRPGSVLDKTKMFNVLFGFTVKVFNLSLTLD